MDKDKLRPVMRRKYKENRTTGRWEDDEDDGEVSGFFHQWVNDGDYIVAIVENDDGTVVSVRMDEMRFTDRGEGGDAR